MPPWQKKGISHYEVWFSIKGQEYLSKEYWQCINEHSKIQWDEAGSLYETLYISSEYALAIAANVYKK